MRSWLLPSERQTWKGRVSAQLCILSLLVSLFFNF